MLLPRNDHRDVSGYISGQHCPLVPTTICEQAERLCGIGMSMVVRLLASLREMGWGLVRSARRSHLGD